MQKLNFEVDKVNHEMDLSLLINCGNSDESKKWSYVNLLFSQRTGQVHNSHS